MCCGAIAETQIATMNRRTSRYVSEAFLNPMGLPADFIETSPCAADATVTPEPGVDSNEDPMPAIRRVASYAAMVRKVAQVSRTL
jgi:hypothetical protein